MVLPRVRRPLLRMLDVSISLRSSSSSSRSSVAVERGLVLVVGGSEGWVGRMVLWGKEGVVEVVEWGAKDGGEGEGHARVGR